MPDRYESPMAMPMSRQREDETAVSLSARPPAPTALPGSPSGQHPPALCHPRTAREMRISPTVVAVVGRRRRAAVVVARRRRVVARPLIVARRRRPTSGALARLLRLGPRNAPALGPGASSPPRVNAPPSRRRGPARVVSSARVVAVQSWSLERSALSAQLRHFLPYSPGAALAAAGEMRPPPAGRFFWPEGAAGQSREIAPAREQHSSGPKSGRRSLRRRKIAQSVHLCFFRRVFTFSAIAT